MYCIICVKELWNLINICVMYLVELGIFFFDNVNDMINV